MFTVQGLERIERVVYAAGPAAGFVIGDKAARRRRLVDRLAEAPAERLIVDAVRRGGDLKLAEQGWIALDELDDHRNERCARLILEVGADAGECAGAARLDLGTDFIRGQRGRDHVLAESVVVERGTVALAADRFALAEEIDAVVLRSLDLRQHALGFDGEDLDAPFPMIGFAAGESRASAPPQSLDVEAREIFDRHAAATPFRLPASRARGRASGGGGA